MITCGPRDVRSYTLFIYTLDIYTYIYLEDHWNSGSDDLYLSFYKINYIFARRLSSASPLLVVLHPSSCADCPQFLWRQR